MESYDVIRLINKNPSGLFGEPYQYSTIYALLVLCIAITALFMSKYFYLPLLILFFLIYALFGIRIISKKVYSTADDEVKGDIRYIIERLSKYRKKNRRRTSIKIMKAIASIVPIIDTYRLFAPLPKRVKNLQNFSSIPTIKIKE